MPCNIYNLLKIGVFLLLTSETIRVYTCDCGIENLARLRHMMVRYSVGGPSTTLGLGSGIVHFRCSCTLAARRLPPA